MGFGVNHRTGRPGPAPAPQLRVLPPADEPRFVTTKGGKANE